MNSEHCSALPYEVEDEVVITKLFDLPDAARHCALYPNCGKTHPMQAFDVYDGVAFVTYDGGYVFTYDMETGEMLSQFPLGCSISHDHHCGNAMFGEERFDANDRFPLFYSSGDLTTKACYVERILTDASGRPVGSKLVQWITFDMGEEAGENGAQAIIDSQNHRIIFQQRRYRDIGRVDNVFVMGDYPLPSISMGEYSREKDCRMVHLPVSARTAVYELPGYSPFYQGADYINNRILQSHGPKANAFGSTNGVMVFETDDNHTFSRYINIHKHLGAYEPQSIVVSDNRMYMTYLAPHAGMYELTLDLGLEQCVRVNDLQNDQEMLAVVQQALSAQLTENRKGCRVESLRIKSRNEQAVRVEAQISTPYVRQTVEMRCEMAE